MALSTTVLTKGSDITPARRLVILDDDPAIRKTVTMMARRLGFDATACATLAELESALALCKPDFVLIDLMMPDLDGIDVVRKIELHAGCSLILMSGADRRTVDASCTVLASCGARVAGFLHKPFGAGELAEIMAASPAPSPPRMDLAAERPSPTVLSPAQFEEAVLAGKIEPHFQPIYHSDGRRLKGFEALARIEGVPTDGFAPEYLAQLAADDRLAAVLTDRMIARALRVMAGLPDALNGLSISINLFGSYAVAQGLRERLVKQCARNGIARNRVILELSEATVMNFSDDDLRRITQLRLAGFGLSIDDFGTGHSSLGRLASLPFSELKIDKSFCLALSYSQPAAAVIEACLGLAARLDMTVTAEGVEDEGVAAALAGMGCDALQGHLFGHAMPGETMVRWLHAAEGRFAA